MLIWLQTFALGGSSEVFVVGTPIINADATTERSNYELCQRSGFRQYPQHDHLSKMRIEWTGYGVRTDSLDERNAQDFVGARGDDRQVGPQSSELNDRFISTSIVPEDF